MREDIIFVDVKYVDIILVGNVGELSWWVKKTVGFNLVYIYIYSSICIYIYMCVCIDRYTHTHTHTHTYTQRDP